MGGGKSYAVEAVDLSYLPPALRSRVESANLPKSGEMLNPGQLRELEMSLRGVDEHIRVNGTTRNDKMRVVIGLANSLAPQMQASATAPSTPQQLRIGGNLQSAKLISKATPLYPPEAKMARIQGVVRLNVTIDKEGKVSNIELVSGHPMLVDSAIAAVRQWEYQTTLLNGNPVAVVTTVDVNYTLTE
jgi:TonB family protein